MNEVENEKQQIETARKRATFRAAVADAHQLLSSIGIFICVEMCVLMCIYMRERVFEL